jgi:hypothetical protein
VLTDAVRDVYDIALLVSADSDLRPVSHTRVRNAQLPPEIVIRGGMRLSRPAYWS